VDDGTSCRLKSVSAKENRQLSSEWKKKEGKFFGHKKKQKNIPLSFLSLLSVFNTQQHNIYINEAQTAIVIIHIYTQRNNHGEPGV
jgi:hypothetical protein